MSVKLQLLAKEQLENIIQMEMFARENMVK